MCCDRLSGVAKNQFKQVRIKIATDRNFAGGIGMSHRVQQ
jgi:hypothetical protein